MSESIIIAIDGYSSCGKSTLAKALARKLHYAYVDSGAMYRAVTLYFLNHEIDYTNHQEVVEALDQISISFKYNAELGLNETYLNGLNVEYPIREMRISEKVSEVSKIKEVRKALVQYQQEMGEHRGIVMDGRDIGTVVFPDAELKLFMTADIAVRVQRRYLELKQKGFEQITLEEVQKNLEERDLIDSTRAESPLKQAEDAIVFDNTHLTEVQQLEKATALALERIYLRESEV
ncbi:MAG: (d)CMP kinase [Chitinophagales bacterium]|nr:(d)CMP kinase [Chitinophagales bacterium]